MHHEARRATSSQLIDDYAKVVTVERVGFDT